MRGLGGFEALSNREAASFAAEEIVRALGVQPYVYHDRTSSKVMLGSYQAPNDPAAERVRQAALNVSLQVKKDGETVLQYLAPAGNLTPVPRP